MSDESNGHGLPKYPSSPAEVQQSVDEAMNRPAGTQNVAHAGEPDNNTTSGVRRSRPQDSFSGVQTQNLFNAAMANPTVAQNSPGADGNQIWGTSTRPEFDMGLYHNHLRSKSSTQQIPASSPPVASSPSSSDTLGRSDVQVAINNENASIFHLCYFAEAIYASAGLKWRYGKPDPIIRLPISPNSRFRLTVEVRTNICSPSYGTPWPEMEGCIDKGDFHRHDEGLYGQVQIAFILRKAPETDWRHNSTGNTTSLSQHNQQRQQHAPPPQLTFLKPMYYVPKLFLPTADPSSINDPRIACGQPVDHQHPGKAGLPYPAVLAPGGYLGLCHLGERANQLLTEGQATSMREPALPDGLIPAVRSQLREALRWGMAAELLGRLPVEGEPLVLDEAEFAGLEGELEAATAPLGEWTFLTALMLALGKLREGMLGYEAAKDGAGGEDV